MGSKKAGAFAANNVPGPGMYNPNIGSSKENIGGTKIGTGSRSNLHPGGKDVPGPGSYSITKSLGGPNFGFGSSTRK